MLNWQTFPLRMKFTYGETLCDIRYASGTIEHQAVELKFREKQYYLSWRQRKRLEFGRKLYNIIYIQNLLVIIEA